jgi:hypothetical protein
VRLETGYGEWVERIPAWIKWATQEWNEIQFNGVYYEPEEKGAPGEIAADKAYTFKYPRPPKWVAVFLGGSRGWGSRRSGGGGLRPGLRDWWRRAGCGGAGSGVRLRRGFTRRGAWCWRSGGGRPGGHDAVCSMSRSRRRPPPARPRALRIYECHVGMSSQEPKVRVYTRAHAHAHAGRRYFEGWTRRAVVQYTPGR